MQVKITNSKGTQDITPMTTTVKWSGDYQQIARSLDFDIVCTAADQSVPKVDCPLGAPIQMIENGEPLFDGFIISRTMDTEGTTLSLSCMDRGFHLRRNKIMKKYVAKTPEEIGASIAAEFKIKVGDLAKTGIPITRNFLTGANTVDDIITTSYTLASRETKKTYHMGFRGDALYVTVKAPDSRTLILKGGSNLIAANTTESIEKVVSVVKVYNENDKFVRELRDESRLKLHGHLQEIVKQTKKDKKAAEAQKLLDDGGVSQKITVDCIGNIANVTGGCVVVQEPHTGVYGLFWIDTDVHEWKRGQYFNKLTLNYRNIMSEKEAGSLPNAKGKKTSGQSTGERWAYNYNPDGSVRK